MTRETKNLLSWLGALAIYAIGVGVLFWLGQP